MDATDQSRDRVVHTNKLKPAGMMHIKGFARKGGGINPSKARVVYANE